MTKERKQTISAEDLDSLKTKADSGDAEAKWGLGYCYEYGIGVEKNPKKAVELYTRAAEQGFKAAQCQLGTCFMLGIGVEKNPEKAAELYELAAEQGDAKAQFNLGLCYEFNTGVEEEGLTEKIRLNIALLSYGMAAANKEKNGEVKRISEECIKRCKKSLEKISKENSSKLKPQPETYQVKYEGFSNHRDDVTVPLLKNKEDRQH